MQPGFPSIHRASPLTPGAVQVLLAAVLTCSLLAWPTPSRAATHVVTDFGDTGAPGQLRTLIDLAADGDTIQIPAGTIVLTGTPDENNNVTGDLDLDKSLAIIGAGPGLTILDGGGVDRIFHTFSTSVVILQGLTLRNGDPTAGFDSDGGAIQANGLSLKLIQAVVENSIGGGGGGISLIAGSVAIEESTIRDNESVGVTANGGGILNFGGNLAIFSSTIHDNAVTGTSASTLGGGIANFGALQMRNSTVSGNTITGNLGGGIYAFGVGSSVSLENVTIARNIVDVDRSSGGSGGGVQIGAAFEASNTIIADNRVAGVGADDCSGTLTSLGHNLIGTSSGCTIVGVATGNVLDERSHLGRLRDNGGATWTHLPRRPSPAVDAGDDALCSPVDQRGVARPVDGDRDGTATCDIGAVERVRGARR